MMAEQYQDFNASLLFFLPKKASGTLEDGTVFYDADSVRPLNVTNADNRLLASAVRLLIEPFVASRISPSQRGFIAGRSMLANLIDIDESMAFNAITEESAAALLFDFSAAFPSVEHELLHAQFAALGWPDWLLRFVVVLYQLNHCFIAMDGGAASTASRLAGGYARDVHCRLYYSQWSRTFCYVGFKDYSRGHASKLTRMTWLSLYPRAWNASAI